MRERWWYNSSKLLWHWKFLNFYIPFIRMDSLDNEDSRSCIYSGATIGELLANWHGFVNVVNAYWWWKGYGLSSWHAIYHQVVCNVSLNVTSLKFYFTSTYIGFTFYRHFWRRITSRNPSLSRSGRTDNNIVLWCRSISWWWRGVWCDGSISRTSTTISDMFWYKYRL